jgi:hypothetical protein
MRLIKTLTEKGKNGTFKGIIEVELDYRRDQHEVRNPSSHEEELKTFNYSRVIGRIEGTHIRFESPDFRGDTILMNYVNEIISKVHHELKGLANEPRRVDVIETLQMEGFLSPGQQGMEDTHNIPDNIGGIDISKSEFQGYGGGSTEGGGATGDFGNTGGIENPDNNY